MPIDLQQLAHAGIRSLIPYKPGKAIEEVQREKGLSDIIKMASNENPLGCSPLALKALREMSPHLVALYPSPVNHPLMLKLALKLGVHPEQLFLSNGSDYIYNLLLNCYVLHSDKHIVTHEYAFSTYAIQAHSLQIPVRTVPVNADWQVNIQHLLQTCTEKTGIIFLANPNNPTGSLVSQEQIKYLLEHMPQSTLLVLDEAYYEFAASRQSCNSQDWLQEHPNLVITRTFSKIYGMAGLRLGYMMAHPDLVSVLQRLQLPFTVNQAALSAGYAALDDEAFIQLSLKLNQEGMEQLRASFNERRIDYLPSACNFLTFDCKEDALALYNHLLDNGIIVRPLHAYKMNHYIRVTSGTKEHNTRFLNALTDYYQ